MTLEENISLEKRFNEFFYGELEDQVYLREDRHDIETIDFIAKNILDFLSFVKVCPLQAKHILIINNHQHFKFINAQAGKTLKNIKDWKKFTMRDIVKHPELYDPDIKVIFKTYWVTPIREDVPQKVLYDLINN